MNLEGSIENDPSPSEPSHTSQPSTSARHHAWSHRAKIGLHPSPPSTTSSQTIPGYDLLPNYPYSADASTPETQRTPITLATTTPRSNPGLWRTWASPAPWYQGTVAGLGVGQPRVRLTVSGNELLIYLNIISLESIYFNLLFHCLLPVKHPDPSGEAGRPCQYRARTRCTGSGSRSKPALRLLRLFHHTNPIAVGVLKVVFKFEGQRWPFGLYERSMGRSSLLNERGCRPAAGLRQKNKTYTHCRLRLKFLSNISYNDTFFYARPLVYLRIIGKQIFSKRHTMVLGGVGLGAPAIVGILPLRRADFAWGCKISGYDTKYLQTFSWRVNSTM